MRVRRCAILLIEPREALAFDLSAIPGGGTGLSRRRSLVALAAHLGTEVEIDRDECDLLARLSPGDWVEAATIDDPGKSLARLLETGLVLVDGATDGDAGARDARLRGLHWEPLAATLHAFTRWDGVEAVAHMRENKLDSAEGLRDSLGTPPAEVPAPLPDDARTPLPWSPPAALDELMARRATCRNFDAARALPQALFAQLMQRVFAVQGKVDTGDGLVFFKKNVPSGGALHPIDAFLAVQNVEGILPGLYRYDPVAHALDRLPGQVASVGRFLHDAMAGQAWFADAHAAVVLAPRFDRSFWKYRRHAKAYRVLAMEAGHISQTLYLSATEAGLGAFVTGAINEKQLEVAFGLEPLSQGALAICGFGWRSPVMETAELDPACGVWAPAPS